MGKVIIFPTDTVYGIGCSIWDKDGIDRIYAIKHRSKDKPLACLCADLNQIEQIAIVDDKAKLLIKHFLPGALTLILKSKNKVLESIGYPTIGVRIPDCKEALEILNFNGPMLTTSVNESGMTALNDYEQIVSFYGALVDEIVPPTKISSNVASTVLSIIDGKVTVLRAGSITLEMINQVLNV
ncbi:MAG: threonylcarbamoyl-AMP synthase [Anaeroplasmataceae bacterium]|nr:threonylcarbamoyl-AMP synthase [Anaeroplasmataceae bacterium]